MRLAFIVLLFLTMANALSAQSRQQQKVDSIFQQVKKYFNLKNADAIYNLGGKDFQNELDINAFSDVANKQLFPLGAIRESSLVSFVNNSIGTYNLKFDSLKLQLLISLDQRDKLQLFLFQPYKEPVGDKTALVATSNPLKSAIDKKIDTLARLYIQKANTVGLVIGIINHGDIMSYGYGETVKGKGKIPNNDNFFEIGSVTKTFTATLLAWYANAGMIKLTDHIVKYLPDSVAANPALQSITLLNLCNHTSGLANLPDNLVNHASEALNPYKDYNKDLLFDYLKTCQLNSKPGEKYTYSNLAVGLLGTILEKVTGKTFEQMVTEVICKPLDMFSTAQYLNPLLSPRFAAVYNLDGVQTPAWDFDVLAPAGALRSTMNDMLIYANANMQTASTGALSKALQSTHQVTFNKDVKIGMAWHIIVVNGVNYYYHNGITSGSNSFMAFNPEKNIAVIVLANSVESTDALGTEILKRIQ